MKRGINKVTLMGNVGDDPRVNQINDTVKVARFPLATNEVYLDKEETKILHITESNLRKGDHFHAVDLDHHATRHPR